MISYFYRYGLLFINQFLVLLFLYTWPWTCFAAGRYQIDDLKSLFQENNYREYLAHALDILPSKRGEDWKKMTFKMSYQLADELLLQPQGQGKKELHTLFKKIEKWPLLKDDVFFLEKKALLLFKETKTCFEKAQMAQSKKLYCYNQAVGFFKNIKLTNELAKNLGDLVAHHLQNLGLAFDFYQRMASDKNSNFYCKGDEFIRSAFSQIIKLAKANQKYDQLNHHLHKYFHKNCLNEIWPIFVDKHLKKFSDKSWPWLFHAYWASKDQSKENLTPRESSLLVVYWLESNLINETLTFSWSHLKIISKDQNYRSKVLSELKSLDPLPGKIFSSIDKNKKEFFISFFNKNFPEYIPYYAKICTLFREGKINFLKGNPALYCDDLFEYKQIASILEKKQLERFKAATNFK